MEEVRRIGLLGWAYIVVGLVLLWLMLSREYPLIVPSPFETLTYILRLSPTVLFHSILRTLTNTLAGFAVSLLLGLFSLAVYHLNPYAKGFIEALNTFVQSVSVLVWSLVFLLIFGVTSHLAPMLVVTAASYPIVLSSIIGGVKNIDQKYGELARSLGASKWQELYYFTLPGALPYVVSSSRAAIGVALRISVVAEAFGSSGGVGYQLAYSFDIGMKTGVFAWAVILVSLMIIVDQLLLKPLEGWSRRWM